MVRNLFGERYSCAGTMTAIVKIDGQVAFFVAE